MLILLLVCTLAISLLESLSIASQQFPKIMPVGAFPNWAGSRMAGTWLGEEHERA
jgi:hypothetical protein